MAEVVHEDIVEHILIGLDVEDLISCMRVCKSWYSLITSPRFVTLHLSHSYNKDPYNNELVHRRIFFITHLGFGSHHLVGSSNGLVCIFSLQDRKVFVRNPLTREVRQLRSLPLVIHHVGVLVMIHPRMTTLLSQWPTKARTVHMFKC
ncbi:putative F-box domain-containing protein [Helianthus annuus]|nr:putative F-box domain-containing protein [Helianthus annuus]